MIRRGIELVLVGMVLFYVVKNPDRVAGALKGIASGAGNFITALVG